MLLLIDFESLCSMFSAFIILRQTQTAVFLGEFGKGKSLSDCFYSLQGVDAEQFKHITAKIKPHRKQASSAQNMFNTDNEAFLCTFHYSCIPDQILLNMRRVLTHTRTQGVTREKVNQLVLDSQAFNTPAALINTHAGYRIHLHPLCFTHMAFDLKKQTRFATRATSSSPC